MRLLTLCCDRKSRAACAQSFAPWQQATIEITRLDHSIIACSHYAYIFLFFAHIPFMVNHTINATPLERLQHLTFECFFFVFAIQWYYWQSSKLFSELAFEDFLCLYFRVTRCFMLRLQCELNAPQVAPYQMCLLWPLRCCLCMFQLYWVAWPCFVQRCVHVLIVCEKSKLSRCDVHLWQKHFRQNMFIALRL